MMKQHKTFARTLAAGALALSLIPLGGAFAQTATPSPSPTVTVTPSATVTITPASNVIELVGRIDSVSGTTITVLGQTIDASRAELKTALTVGTVVKVEGTLLSTGVIAAREVELHEERDDDRNEVGVFELYGTLTSLNATTAVVAGVSVNLVGAEIYPGVQVGGLVEIKYILVNGRATALELEPLTATEFADELNDVSGRDDDDDDTDDRGGRGGDDDRDDDDRGGRGGDDQRGDDNSGSGNSGSGSDDNDDDDDDDSDDDDDDDSDDDN
jgi:hypothetical protein